MDKGKRDTSDIIALIVAIILAVSILIVGFPFSLYLIIGPICLFIFAKIIGTLLDLLDELLP